MGRITRPKAFTLLALLAVAGCGLFSPAAEPEPPWTRWRPAPGSVHFVALSGAEDIVVDAATGTAYVSARESLHTLTCDGLAPRPLTLAPARGLRPHGIDLTADGAVLMVVNHAPPGETIELIRLASGAITTVELSERANDVAAVDANRFLVTIPVTGMPWMLGALLGTSTGAVWSFDGARLTPISDGLPFPNGIARTRAGRVLIATTMDGSLRVHDATLAHARRIPLGFGVDNVSVEDNGDIAWVAGHPDLPRLALDRVLGTAQAPSRVARVDLAAGRATIVLDEHTAGIAGASVAAVQSCPGRPGRRLLVGSVSDAKLAIIEGLPE